jgi:hypothetical protein
MASPGETLGNPWPPFAIHLCKSSKKVNAPFVVFDEMQGCPPAIEEGCEGLTHEGA